MPIVVSGLQTNSSVFGRTVTQRCHWKDFETEAPIKDLPVGTKFYAVYKKNGKEVYSRTIGEVEERTEAYGYEFGCSGDRKLRKFPRPLKHIKNCCSGIMGVFSEQFEEI